MSKRSAPSGQGGLSLERFARAKTSTYDKQHRKEKEFALNAKKVNKYRKLKQRMLKTGKLRPSFQIPDEDNSDDAPEPSSRKKRKGSAFGGEDMARIQARAGPPPEEGSDDGDDMVGAESDYETGDEAAQQQQVRGPAYAAGMQRLEQAAGTSRQRFPSVAGAADGVQHPIQRPSAGHLDAVHEAGIAQHSGRHMGGGAGPHERVADGGSEDGKPGGVTGDALLEAHSKGRKRRDKPMSRMQRIAANVKAQKEEEARAREQRKREIEAHRARVAEVEKQRKQQTKLLRKRTRHGQPVMKFRVDKILEQLQAEAKAGS